MLQRAQRLKVAPHGLGNTPAQGIDGKGVANRNLEQVGDPEIPQIIQVQIVSRIDTEAAGGRCRSRFLKLREYGVKIASFMSSGVALGIELDSVGAQEDPGIDLMALDEVLEELGRLNERHRRVVELRFFGGLSVEETAHVLEVSPQTVRSDWRMARAWLRQRLDR